MLNKVSFGGIVTPIFLFKSSGHPMTTFFDKSSVNPNKSTSKTPPSIMFLARQNGLNRDFLAESCFELAREGILTASCLEEASRILLSELGLPRYFFKNLKKSSLKEVIGTIASNVEYRNGSFSLRPDVTQVELGVGNIQIRVATEHNRAQMEKVLDQVMAGQRVEYYRGKDGRYFTYIVHCETCPSLESVQKGRSAFAFSAIDDKRAIVPFETRERYEAFLKKVEGRIDRLIETSFVKEQNEIRIMFLDDFDHSPLPVIRKMLEECGVNLKRAYWETFRSKMGRESSICSLYIPREQGDLYIGEIRNSLNSLSSVNTGQLDNLYLSNELSFNEFIFATVASSFVHTFIHQCDHVDQRVMDLLVNDTSLLTTYREKIFSSQRADFSQRSILEAIESHPYFIRTIYSFFDAKFNPETSCPHEVSKIDLESFYRRLEIEFANEDAKCEIFKFMTRLVTDTLKTNFYLPSKRSCAFRLSGDTLDTRVFPTPVYAIFFAQGFNATGVHMRAENIARGGLRFTPVSHENFEHMSDQMVPLVYALGPLAQRIKHKDILESGAKGVIVPILRTDMTHSPHRATEGEIQSSIFDLTEGIMDLVQENRMIVDYLREPEIVFFGPDENTASCMDAVSYRGKERNYKYWRTLTTGKSIGLPHDAYGLLEDGRLFGLLGHKGSNTELEINGTTQIKSSNMDDIYGVIGDRIKISGMTTTSVMSTFRELLRQANMPEEHARMAMTGGPDGDLGANQIQSFKGTICLVIDSGGILFDPAGLDKKELRKLAFARHTDPRLNSSFYPEELLSTGGFKIAPLRQSYKLPHGVYIEDGSYFHKNVLSDPSLRDIIKEASINVFLPAGGRKNTISGNNVEDFLRIFSDLKVIVEGANVFFSDEAREVIATGTNIFHVKDSSANKGGVTSSSLGEVLPALLLGEAYEAVMVDNPKKRTEMIRSILSIIDVNARREARMLTELNRQSQTPLYVLSTVTSEQILDAQRMLYEKLPNILSKREVIDMIYTAYIPSPLLEEVGLEHVHSIFSQKSLQGYRDALLTKKIASEGLYRFYPEWNDFLKRLQSNPVETTRALFEDK